MQCFHHWYQCVTQEQADALQGSSSSFYPYIETLPAEHDCVICWSKGQLAELQGKLSLQLSFISP